MANDPYNPNNPTSNTTDNSSYNALDPYYRASAGTPLWGWISGADQMVQQAHQQDASAQNRGYWLGIQPPSVDQLMGPDEDRDAQTRALAQLQQWASGAPTTADWQNLNAQRQQDAQTARGARDALQQQASARGIGGSGLELAAQMQANQAAQQQTSNAESAMLSGVQQRSLGAAQAASTAAGNLRSADVGAVQQAYDNALHRAAGITNQYSTDTGARSSAAQQQQENNQALAAGLAQIVASL